MEKQGVKTRDLVEMALFAAIIVILAFTPLGYIPLGLLHQQLFIYQLLLQVLF